MSVAVFVCVPRRERCIGLCEGGQETEKERESKLRDRAIVTLETGSSSSVRLRVKLMLGIEWAEEEARRPLCRF